jgi:hypothetical protein
MVLVLAVLVLADGTPALLMVLVVLVLAVLMGLDSLQNSCARNDSR